MLHAHTTQINKCKLCFSIKKQQYLLYVCYILLLQASDIDLNHGPNTTTFPCNICGNEVDWDQKAVACDNCSDWYHTSCMHINSYHSKNQTYHGYATTMAYQISQAAFSSLLKLLHQAHSKTSLMRMY